MYKCVFLYNLDEKTGILNDVDDYTTKTHDYDE